jgi:hypothetical protein
MLWVCMSEFDLKGIVSNPSRSGVALAIQSDIISLVTSSSMDTKHFVYIGI